MYYVYVLKSQKTDRYYIGSTGNLEDRLIRHNSSRSKLTKKEAPWKLVYSELYSSRKEAVKREKQIKSYHGGNEFKRLFK
ncbi:GIY-YIG nuclease family protein [Patescibacteria group bacterium]|nr:GIY-YIG nuclease family protein [Patescibacteria group bacterium]